ncbi:hypothetical protein CE91St56_59070 [Lachnospiraceae bacterium]|nr:hypothetical protein CE91St56_59070 [Lachnospiraceae bacterium]GKH44864.1 hypothetical protein CE91St57_58380 [Lachnospiraceae bacterium]
MQYFQIIFIDMPVTYAHPLIAPIITVRQGFVPKNKSLYNVIVDILFIILLIILATFVG